MAQRREGRVVFETWCSRVGGILQQTAVVCVLTAWKLLKTIQCL